MTSLRFGSTVSALTLATILSGCAAPMSRSASDLNSSKANLAYGLRAQVALESGDLASAVDLSEKAVETSPQDANVRTLLGNAYFAAGRFASAEAAFGDALSLAPAQPQLILKRALVQIAQGKTGEALTQLQSSRGLIDPADYGLAVALAGEPAEAINVLEGAARAPGADARTRQNLALAYALAGDWTAARTIAAQDLAPGELDARVQQWMAMAQPGRAVDQVAALVGVRPAATDPGQPVRLALNADATRLASAAPAPQPAPEALAETQPIALPAPAFASEQQSANAAIESAAAIAPAGAPATNDFPAMDEFVSVQKPAAAPRKAAAASRSRAPHALGNAKAVVQLGAYSSEARVSVAWAQLTKRYPALAQYSPVTARFDGPKGTVWRLSIRGFGNQQEAIARCQSLRTKGGSCFVRSTAGDAPVQFASR